MTTAVATAATRTSPDSEMMVKRVFRVAEILSRRRLVAEVSEFSDENSPEKHGREEIGYLETKDQMNDA